jgi:demethylmenaquinone methyltransferase/2-methoxy-6-polyprenyl-1,4-benzoquinol methylase
MRSLCRPGIPVQRAPAAAAVPKPAYTDEARLYDERTQAFQGYRRAIVEALALHRGDVVLDVGCGTGLCFPMLVEKVGSQGGVVGIDASAEMVAVARDRVARESWGNVEVVQAPIADAPLPADADAALLCAVHDILQSPEALRKVMESLRPGAQVVAGGGKWAPPWMVGLNLQVQALHAPYVNSFAGFERPWNHLGRFIDDLRVRNLAFGTGYVATGQYAGAAAG